MKRFTTRILVCAIPTLLAALIVARAAYLNEQGQGGFKLGVDLVGGTILVYEADADRTGKNANFDPAEMAAQLKRRIDPSDLYNVTIRPVAGNRFEIILPTGGAKQAQKEREAWDALVEKVRANAAWQAYLAGTDLDVTVGNTKDLALRVSQIVNAQALKQKLLDKYPALKAKPDVKLDELVTAPTARVVEALKGPAEAKEDELTKLVEDARATAKPEDVDAFVKANFAGGKRFVSAEKVQEIKDLISRQGSLEFRIVANKHRDGAAFKAAENYFKDAANKQALDEAARNGLPPAPPKAPEGAEPFEFTYSWVEVSKNARSQMGLNNASRGGPQWNAVDAARQKGEPAVLTREAGGRGSGSSDGQYQYMVYSRKTDNVRLPAAEREQKQFDYFMLVRNPVTPDKAITGRYLTNAQVSDIKLEPAVDFAFDSTGAALFAEITSGNLPEGQAPSKLYAALAIMLDGEIVSFPSINSTISDHGEITGFRAEEARKLAMILKSGALPATLKPQPVSENTIGATLGDDTIKKGTWSIAFAFVAVMAFMVVYYRFAGAVACVALVANLLFTVAFMVFVNATFTLPGLAGLVLTLGMAVDANVLIYERLREERERGMNLITALRQGYDRALPTIIDTHLTSIFTAIVLYAVGNDQLKGFGISLASGLVISLFTSLYMTRLIFDIWQYKGWLTKLSMYQGLTNWIHRHYFDFMSVRKYWFAATATLTVLGLGLFLYRGPSGLNIDFVGGTAYGGRLAEPQDIGTLRHLLGADNQAKRLAVEKVEQRDDKGFSFAVTFKDGTSQLVQLSHEAPGATNAEREKNVAERAAVLPDWSVDQIFPSNEPSTGGRSRFFTVRTTEREPDLVQVAIDRLLRDVANKSLLETVKIQTIDVKDKSATLTFDKLASPGYLKLLLNRQFAVNKLADAAPFELRGTGKGVDGRYQAMTLEVAGSGVPADQLKSMLAETQKAFEARPQPERLENFDAQLAAETSRRALYAVLASWLAVLLYLWFRFGTWQFGAAAVACLVHDLCFTLGVIAVCHYVVLWVPGLAHLLGLEDFKIDLPAVAALLTLVGYSVNDTIVVLDRIREVRGKNPLLTEKTINDSVNQTLTRTLLASLTVWLVVLVLYIWGGEGVKLFAFVMVVGVFVGTYSSIYIAAPLLLIFGEGQPAKTPGRKLEPVGAK